MRTIISILRYIKVFPIYGNSKISPERSFKTTGEVLGITLRQKLSARSLARNL